MRLINTDTLVLEEYFGEQIPKYAILSHTWRGGEVSHQDWQNVHSRSKKEGFKKIQQACLIAESMSLKYLWVDTNCINKDSSAELSEAINSMYSWYRDAQICLVYIDDYHHNKKPGLDLASLAASRWFGRGWTLQELLAPREVRFYDTLWHSFGSKLDLLQELYKITSIRPRYLMHPNSIRQATVSRKMSWISRRSTSRAEDMAYCMLGLFDINMPLLYGEGFKAFIRLQEEIIKQNTDHTLFCWEQEAPDQWYGCCSPRPAFFRNAGGLLSTKAIGSDITPEYQITNNGLRISLPMLSCLLTDDVKLAFLNAQHDTFSKSHRLCILLQKTLQGETFARSELMTHPLHLPSEWWQGDVSTVYVVHEREPGRKFTDIRTRAMTFVTFETFEGSSYGVLPLISSSDASKYSLRKVANSLQHLHPVVGLTHEDQDVWVSKEPIKLDSDEFGPVTVLFKVRIGELETGIWQITTLLHGTIKSSQTKIDRQCSALVQSEFTVPSIFGTTRVRPVLVSFPDYISVHQP